MIVHLLFGALAASLPLTQAPWQQECEHEATRTATLAVAKGARLDLKAAAGSLRVEGKAGAKDVRVRGRACASSASLLSELQLRTRNTGGVVYVETLQPDEAGRGDDYAYMDLVLEVPAGMDASVEDGSGSAVLSELGALDVADGSGELRIDGATGAVRVRDGSGELRVSGVRGDVTIEDGSGATIVRDVTGAVHVLDEGSGDLTVERAGSLTVDHAGSGALSYGDIKGRVIVPERRRR